MIRPAATYGSPSRLQSLLAVFQLSLCCPHPACSPVRAQPLHRMPRYDCCLALNLIRYELHHTVAAFGTSMYQEWGVRFRHVMCLPHPTQLQPCFARIDACALWQAVSYRTQGGGHSDVRPALRSNDFRLQHMETPCQSTLLLSAPWSDSTPEALLAAYLLQRTCSLGRPFHKVAPLLLCRLEYSIFTTVRSR